MTPAAPTPGDWLSALKTSHERLAADVGELTVKELAGPSYDREWSIAQVLSHLGSGADIFSLVLRAGRRGEPAPELADIESIWARWNARTPEDQVVYALVADRTLVAEFEELDEAQRESWHLSFFGSEQDFGDLLRYRLSEHALHTWDAEVPRHPAATLAPDATALLVDTLPQFVGRLGPPAGSPRRVLVSTTRPERRLLLVAGDTVELHPVGDDDHAGADTEAEAGGASHLGLPAEAFIRLVAGRMDPQHSPAVEGDADLDALRRLFPGF